MDIKGDRVVIYLTQTPIVVRCVEEKGVSYVKKEYIERKYGDTAKIFLEVYNWFVNKAKEIVFKPIESEYVVWGFTDKRYAGKYVDTYSLTLEIPINEVIFFKSEDWNKILNLSYVAKDIDEEKKFLNKIDKYSITDQSEIYMKPFYPQLKSEIKKSWNNLFRYDKEIKAGILKEGEYQIAIWYIKKEWIIRCERNN